MARREVAAGVVLGSLLATVGLCRILLWQSIWKSYGEHFLAIGVTVAFSLLGVVLFGTVAGSMLPFALRRVGLNRQALPRHFSRPWWM